MTLLFYPFFAFKHKSECEMCTNLPKPLDKPKKRAYNGKKSRKGDDKDVCLRYDTYIIHRCLF